MKNKFSTDLSIQYISLCLMFILIFTNLRASEHNKPIIKEVSKNRKEIKLNKRRAKAEKFLKSKVGQWLIRKMEKKAEKRRLRIEKRIAKGKRIKQKHKENADFFSLGIGLLIGGGLALVLGFLFLLVSRGLGIIFLIIGGSIFVAGVIFMALGMLEV